MCGFIVKNIDQDSLGLSQILDHRGPDETGKFSDDHVLMIHNRLSIIDLSSSGRQPMRSSSEN